jgi:opacity protein-like surface antigen
MKKIILSIVLIVLLAPLVSAQENVPSGGQYQLGTPFEGDVRLGYRWNMNSGNPMAGEYEYQHSSAAGSAVIEYDPLPHRFLFETYVQNEKDYFGELDYSYKDVFMLNMTSRSLFHNLDHYSLGQDDPSTLTPYFTDMNSGDLYGTSNAMNRIQVRVKTPDFPFHIYLEAKNQEKHGTIQQRFLSSFSGGFNKLSRSREIDYETEEAKATVNSHLGPVEVEYSHAAKKFSDTHGKVMTDTVPGGSLSYTHNLVPDLESAVDTVKIHTSHTGRISASATYSSGDRKNTDSNAKATFVNAAGDFGWIPTKDVTVAVKYRRHSVDQENPDTVSVLTSLNTTTTASVRNAINYQKDIMSGMIRYRATDRLTVRAEIAFESLNRDVWTGDPAGNWQLDDKVTRNTARLGATYRLTNKLMLRGDISHQTAAVPANSDDITYPETSDVARGTLTWMPKSWFNWLLSAGTIREERSDLGGVFTDKWTKEQNRVLSAITFILGKKTSITPSYAFFQNKQNGPIAYADSTGAITAESGVPYADTSHVASLAVSYALADAMLLTVEGGRSWSRGSWQNSGVVAGSTGIAELANLKLVETVAVANLDVRYTKNLGTEFRYQVRKLDDILDSAQDGTNQVVLATLSYRW